MAMETMAYRIRTRREELGLKQADLAAICGVSPTGVAKWERGLTHNLKSEHLFVLADALNVNPRWLALGDGPKVASSDREAYHFAITKAVKAADREQTAWHRIAAAFSRAALLVMALTASQQGDAAISHKNSSDAHFLAKSLNGIHILLLRLFRKMFVSGHPLVVKTLPGGGGVRCVPIIGIPRYLLRPFLTRDTWLGTTEEGREATSVACSASRRSSAWGLPYAMRSTPPTISSPSS